MAKRASKKENQVVEAVEMAEEAEVQAAQEELVDFDTWFSDREASIPSQHRKEILKADFDARKVPAMATMADFDKALEKYGIKLI